MTIDLDKVLLYIFVSNESFEQLHMQNLLLLIGYLNMAYTVKTDLFFDQTYAKK